MRELFPGYSGQDEAELQEMWESALIVVDTNVLLDWYAQTPKTRSAMVNLLLGQRDRMWIPHQVALEFQRNKDAKRDNATASHRNLGNTVRQQRAGPSDYRRKGRLRAEHFQRRPGVGGRGRAIPTRAHGPPFTGKQLSKHRRLGLERYAAEVPPGWADLGTKKGDRVFGDYFLWVQTMKRARKSEQDVILVTNEQKPDWANEKKKYHPELFNEFFNETGRRLVIYKPGEFIEEAKFRLGVGGSAEDIDEVVRELDEQADESLATSWLTSSTAGIITSLGDLMGGRPKGSSLSDYLGLAMTETLGKTDSIYKRLGLDSGVGALDIYNWNASGLSSIAAASRFAAEQPGEFRTKTAEIAYQLAREAEERKRVLRDATGVAAVGAIPSDDASDDEVIEDE